MLHFLLLFIPGIIGGAINAVAGGGGILLYPALLASGLAPLIANATSSLVVWPGNVASVYGYRKELNKVPRSYLWLCVPSFIGSLIGCYILVHTRATTFEKLAPWLVLSAVLLLALQTRIHRWLSRQTKKRKIHWHTMPLIFAIVFPLAIYGGFFGVGFGLMMLALLGFTSLKNIHQMNAVKNICGITMAVVATVYFARVGLIQWGSGLIMAAGGIVGGYLGTRMAQKVSDHLVHNVTVAIGLVISVVLLLK